MKQHPTNGRELEDAYALSPMQQGMLFHSLLEEGSGVYVEQAVFELPEAVDASALRRAWKSVVARHSVLRTSFRWEGLVEPVQEVRLEVEVPWTELDWRQFGPAEREAQLSDFLLGDRRRGFDPSQAPLLRVTLFQWNETESRLLWTFHHALLDGRSCVLVIMEVFAFYDDFRVGKDLKLPQPRPYRDHIHWLQQQDFSRAECYWRTLLKSFTAPTPLGVDTSQDLGDTRQRRQGSEEAWLPTGLRAALQSLAHENQLTLNSLVKGAWALLLSRYSGETDVVFGVTRACRQSSIERASEMVGNFINTLPMRIEVNPDAELMRWLKELRNQWVRMRDHEHTPLARIQAWSAVPGGKALFDSAVIFENFHLNTMLRMKGGSWSNRQLQFFGQPHFAATLAVYVADELCMKINFDRSRLDGAPVRRMLGHLRTLLEGMIANPNGRLSELPLLTSAERHQILVEWNNTAAEYPANRCIHELVEEQAKRTPEAVAVIFEGQQLTYRELNARANQLARHLQKFGVAPDCLVGICIERSLEMVIGLLGILKAGGAYVPLDPHYPNERLQFIIKDSKISALLTQAKLLAGLPAFSAEAICLDEFVANGADDDLPPTATPHNLAYVIYTSGSTGKPKGAMITHQGLVNYLSWAAKAYKVADGEGAPIHSSISFDLTITGLFTPLLVGRCVYMLREDSGVETLSTMLRQAGHLSLVKITPAHLEMLRSELTPREASGRTHAFIIGGEALQGEAVSFWQDNAPDTVLVNEYGPTETVVGCCVYFVPRECRFKGEIPIGRPIANTQLYILDDHLQPVPIGIKGELYIAGHGVARGYLNRPDLTAEKFVRNPFDFTMMYKSGDIARYLPDGNLEFLGRIDDQVKIRGFRIELGEIESVLLGHPAVVACTVIAREDSPRDKRLVAYLVSRNGIVSSSALREYLQVKLPDYMIPAAFVTLEQIPLTPNGKVDRKALPAPGARKIEIERAYVAPGNYLEEILCGIWRKVLDLQRVGVQDNFFERGGHSLLAVRLIGEINRSLKTHLRIPTLFQNPTIGKLAGVLAQEQHARPEPQLIALQRGQSGGALFYLDAGMGLCRLAELCDTGPASFATVVPAPGPMLRAASLDQLAGLPSMEELAAPHASLIRNHPDSNPCILVGHCFGGLLAFEVARQLEQEGRRVQMIFLLESWAALPPWWRKLKVLTFSRASKSLAFRTKFLMNSLFARAAKQATGTGDKSNSLNPFLEDVTLTFGEVPWEILSKIYLNARKNCRWQTLESRALVIRARESEFAPFYAIDSSLGWSGLFKGGLEIADSPGDHFSLLQEPHLRFVAQLFKKSLEELSPEARA